MTPREQRKVLVLAFFVSCVIFGFYLHRLRTTPVITDASQQQQQQLQQRQLHHQHQHQQQQLLPIRDDRLLTADQLRATDDKHALASQVPANYKIITFGTKWFGRSWYIANGVHAFSGCPNAMCYVFGVEHFEDEWLRKRADAVLFHIREKPMKSPLPIPDYHPPHQRWVFNMRETPIYTYRNLSEYNGIFNWTMTYRSDSDIYSPHGTFVPYKNSTRQDTLDNVHPDKNYAAGKTGLISWFVSHCVTDSKREHYVAKLLRFVRVDIYGLCSPKQKECIRTPGSKLAITEDCTANVVSNYKFYLAFENCNCREYITEKFWRNALQTNSVPIVMGAPREDLRRFAPPGSYIHVDDFETVEQLANYLQELDADDVAYSRYFRWKQLGEVFMMPRDAYCRLCEALHDANAPVQWYDHIDYWWSKTDCVAPHKDIDEETGMGLRNDPNKFKISAPK